MKKVLLVLTIILALIGFVFSIYYYKINTRNSIDVLVENKKMINILIAASNKYQDNKHDFYAVLSINPENSKVGMTFLPPELEIDLEEDGNVIPLKNVHMHDFEKLSAFLFKTIKIKIPFYVTLYAPDIVRTVDMLEGIDLYMFEDIENIKYNKMYLNYFDGEKIIKYINSVEENSIYKKYDRIQDILYTLYYQRKKFEKYVNFDFMYELTRTIEKNTNILNQEFLSISKIIMKEGNLICTILPGQYSSEGNFYHDDIASKHYENHFLRWLVFNQENDKNIKVKIMNGTNISGLARKVRNMLVREGVNVIEFGTSPYPKIDRTVIINQDGNMEASNRVSELIGINRIYHKTDNTQLHSVLIIIGKDMAK